MLPTRASLPLIAYAGTLASVVLPFLWMQGVRYLGPNRCSMFMNLLPVATRRSPSAGSASACTATTCWGGAALAGVVLRRRCGAAGRPHVPTCETAGG